MCTTLGVLTPHPGTVGMGSSGGLRKGNVSSVAMSNSTRLIGKLDMAVVEFKNLTFLITERPSESSMDAFIGVSCLLVPVLFLIFPIRDSRFQNFIN